MAEAALLGETRALAAIYGRLVGVRVRAQLAYPTSFAIGVISAIFGTVVDFLAILIVFNHIPQLDGWTVAQVALLYGMSGVSFGICDLVVGHLDGFGAMVRTGEFDVVLIRPLGSLFQVVAGDFQLRRLGKVAQALAALVYAVVSLGLDWSAGDWALLVASIVSGTVIFTSIWIMGAAICFWTTETVEINNAFTYGGNFLTSYPINIYGVWVRRLLAFAIPLAFVNYFPAIRLLERADPLGFPTWLQVVSPVVAIAVALVARGFWAIAVRHYRSTGS